MRFLEILSFFSFSFHFVGTKPTGNGSLRSESVDDECRCCEGFLSLSLRSRSYFRYLNSFNWLFAKSKKKTKRRASKVTSIPKTKDLKLTSVYWRRRESKRKFTQVLTTSNDPLLIRENPSECSLDVMGTSS